MIGMMILTVAIVSASNLLMGIIDSNRNNLTTLQAYYLSQEGLEMVRNIRDTNWLHNRDWLGKGSVAVWGGQLNIGDNIVNMVDATGSKSYVQKDPLDISAANLIQRVGRQSPWNISNGSGKVYRHVGYMDSISTGKADEDTGFKRTIILEKYDCKYLPAGLCAEDKFVLVQSKIEWDIGAKHRELVLSEVLTNWKGGAL